MYFTAIWNASSMAWKQSPGVLAASTGTGVWEWRPKSAASRSPCSVLVGDAGGRARALDVDHHQRQLDHHREAERLLLQHEAGTAA